MVVQWLRPSLLALGLISATAWGQAMPDVSKDPRLQQLVDVHTKRMLLSDVLQVLHKQTNLTLLQSPDLGSLMVCAFAEKQPLGVIMQDLADALNGQWTDVKTGWRLAEPRENKYNLGIYEAIEKAKLKEDITLRATALASLTSSGHWAGDLANPPAVPPDETPKQWALRASRSRAFFVAGLLFARTPLLTHPDDMWEGVGQILRIGLPGQLPPDCTPNGCGCCHVSLQRTRGVRGGVGGHADHGPSPSVGRDDPGSGCWYEGSATGKAARASFDTLAPSAS